MTIRQGKTSAPTTAVRYWEPRRAGYNALVGAFVFIGLIAHFRDRGALSAAHVATTTLAWFLTANLAFSMAYVAEAVLALLTDDRVRLAARPWLYWSGIAATVLVLIIWCGLEAVTPWGDD